jgi:hypothetical protein
LAGEAGVTETQLPAKIGRVATANSHIEIMK